MAHRIAVIPGDGIGKEVVPEGIRVLNAAGKRFGIELQWEFFPWGCEYYSLQGRMMPPEGLVVLNGFEAIYPAPWVLPRCRIMYLSGACSFLYVRRFGSTSI